MRLSSHSAVEISSNLAVRRALVSLAFMMVAAALAWWLTPTKRIAAEHPIHLESMVPEAFGSWRVDSAAYGGVVNPQQSALLDRLYSQILTRTYVSSKTGERVMLSIAYGEDQRDGMQMHYPEVCYPAQGFEVQSNRVDRLKTALGDLLVRRLETRLGRQRDEAVTYWTIVGDQALLGGMQKKLVEMRYGLRGEIVDGLLFRISTIDHDSQRAFSTQDDFVAQLIDHLPSDARRRLTGLGAPTLDQGGA